MRNLFFSIIAISLLLASCTKPSDPGITLSPTLRDTTVYVLDTLRIGAAATTTGGATITQYRFDYTGDGKWDDSSTADTTFVFVIPETTATSIAVIMEAKDSRGKTERATITVTVQIDSVVLAQKRSLSPDSSFLWYTAFTYNSTGKVAKETRFDTGSTVTGWANLTYSGTTLTKKEHYNADGSKAETEEYLTTRKNIYFSAGTLYGYDSLIYLGAELSQTIFFKADGTEQYRYSYTYTSGKLTRKTYSSTVNAVLNGGYATYEYNGKGRLAYERSYSPSGRLTGWNEYRYDALHRLLK